MGIAYTADPGGDACGVPSAPPLYASFDVVPAPKGAAVHIEAFTRAIETRPAADLYEGRARAYRGLAERDMDAAALLRQRHS